MASNATGIYGEKIGRPRRKKTASESRVTVRLTAAEFRDWTQKAKKEPLTAWIRTQVARGMRSKLSAPLARIDALKLTAAQLEQLEEFAANLTSSEPTTPATLARIAGLRLPTILLAVVEVFAKTLVGVKTEDFIPPEPAPDDDEAALAEMADYVISHYERARSAKRPK